MWKITGAARVASWLVVLHTVTNPWRSLGGLVDERVRWLEWVVVPVGIALGATAGRSGREAGGASVRLLLYPPGVAAALALAALESVGEADRIGVVLTVLLSYGFGLDLVLGAAPLLEGRGFPGAAGRSARAGSPRPPDRRI